ncbi:PREDICTED: 1-acyl-sn-glycerol-3-phosphate acyltransferase gamma [Condylura cristata]|uniref:1-acyl-sn-glycerol-3-phosphate acyltransferase gamma n=1 Tax=Condylura cristata TaxID=143302 RepID=UPI000643BC8A|nr:PREDICTED: 1-acyl-sn-glycerol-3-phosphate acyltransferase gamma [Condylura cristata]
MGLLAFLKTQFVLHLLVGFVFVVSGLLINFTQLCTLVLWPVNKQLYRRLNCRLAYSLWSRECPASRPCPGRARGGPPGGHSARWRARTWGGPACARHLLGLGQQAGIKTGSLLSVPGGTAFQGHSLLGGTAFWGTQPSRGGVGQCPRGGRLTARPPGQFLLYCEGTRFTEKKHRVSMEVAAAKGLPPLKYHLLPRTKGFTTAVQCLRGTVSAVYDVTLNFRGKKIPSLLGILYGKKYEADMCVRRFPLEEIPLDEKEAAQWLHKLYQEKVGWGALGALGALGARAGLWRQLASFFLTFEIKLKA